MNASAGANVGPAAGLPALENLALDGYHLFHETCADLLVRLGRQRDAIIAY
ncbi:MAG: hypothetical protein M3Y77_10890 [Actinomycetota bacterium]|nr:hypothetical protein [Actinomycetota bacterium]MDQ2956436.1 hypothetical protein [Actinomycetota bacterium]